MMNEENNSILYSPEKQMEMLYDKKVTCPVCNSLFKARAIKKGSYRVLDRDSDLFIRYGRINPYFYDVWVCNNCGYAAIKTDFQKISDYEADIIKQKISSKWHSKNIPQVYDLDLAIQRYKLALVNYYTINSKSSKKAITCLKLAWMYRLKNDSKNELDFLNQALDKLIQAYYNESFPLYGMDKFTMMYLIGELKRRNNQEQDSLIWFSEIITSTVASERIKDLARTQKDLIKEETDSRATDENKKNNDHGIFSKFHI